MLQLKTINLISTVPVAPATFVPVIVTVLSSTRLPLLIASRVIQNLGLFGGLYASNSIPGSLLGLILGVRGSHLLSCSHTPKIYFCLFGQSAVFPASM